MEQHYAIKNDADVNKAEEIRRLHDGLDKQKRELLREGQLEMRDELRRSREKDNNIARLEKELSRMTRKLNVSEADKNKLSQDLQTLQSADSWSRRSPTKAPAGIGTPMRTPGSAARRIRTPAGTPRTPYTPQKPKTILEKKVESDRALRELNGKLSLLQKENRALKAKLAEAGTAAVSGDRSDRADKLAKQNTQLSGHARRLTAKTRALETDLSQVKKALSSASEERDRFQSAATKAQGEARAARSAAARARTVAPGSVSSDQHDALNQKRLQVEASLAEQSRVIEKLKHDLKVAKQQARAAAQRQENDEKRVELDAQVRILNVEYTKLQQKFTALAHRNTTRKSQESETKQLQAERDACNAKITDLSGQLSDLIAGLKSSEDQCAAAKGEASSLAEALKAAKAANAQGSASSAVRFVSATSCSSCVRLVYRFAQRSSCSPCQTILVRVVLACAHV